MKKILKQHWLMLLGLVVGGLGGYLYWHFIGCSSGTCPLTSSPVNSTLAGTLLGGLLFSSFDKKKDKDNEKEDK